MIKIRKLLYECSTAIGMGPGEFAGLLLVIGLLFTVAIFPRIYLLRSATPYKVISSDTSHTAWIRSVDALLVERKTLHTQTHQPRTYQGRLPNNAPPLGAPVSDISPPRGEQSKPIEFAPLNLPLNRADAAMLSQIYGIGPVLSERIIKYRNWLGGFVHHDQLKEVYGLTDETIDELILQTYIQQPPATIDVNTDSIKTLAQHPYIDFDLARSIVHYRRQHGDYQNLSDLKNIKLFNDSLFQKLSPYLSL